jgi:hypothetical protein
MFLCRVKLDEGRRKRGVNMGSTTRRGRVPVVGGGHRLVTRHFGRGWLDPLPLRIDAAASAALVPGVSWYACGASRWRPTVIELRTRLLRFGRVCMSVRPIQGHLQLLSFSICLNPGSWRRSLDGDTTFLNDFRPGLEIRLKDAPELFRCGPLRLQSQADQLGL